MKKNLPFRLPEYLRKYYDMLEIPFNSSEEEIEEAYQKFCLQFENDVIGIDKFFKIEIYYDRLIEDIHARKQIYEEEKALRKRKLQVLTERMEKQQKKIKELENYKGPLWVMIENLKTHPQKGTTTEVLAYTRDNILKYLTPQNQEIYCNFLNRFRQLWDELYEKFCDWEQDSLEDNSIDQNNALSVGIDELTDKVFQECACYGDYTDLFQYEKVLTDLIPDNPNYYFLDAHLDIVTKNLSIEYKKSDFIVRIYTFSVNSRLQKLKEQYHKERFKLEHSQGITGVVYIDAEEIKDYIQTHLESYYDVPIKRKK